MNFKQLAINMAIAPMISTIACGYAWASVTPPRIGQIMQQIPPSVPVAPKATVPSIQHAPTAVSGPKSSQKILVRRIQISGNTLLPQSDLDAAIEPYTNKQMTLSSLQGIAEKITALYHRKGYFLSYAYLPPQTIKNGIVRIDILEAKYSKVKLANSSRVDSGLLASVLSPFQPGTPVDLAPLQYRLMLMSTIPGVRVSPAVFSPGQAVGSSNMEIRTTAKPLVQGDVRVDNYGSKYTGREQFGAGLVLNSPLGIGDRLTLEGLTSVTGNLGYGGIGYSVPLDGWGTRFGVKTSYLHYHLGGAAQALHAHGYAWISGAYLTQPFLLNPETSFYGRLEYLHKSLSDNIDVASIFDRRHINEVKAILYGNHRDSLWGGGITSYVLSYTYGNVAFNNANAEAADAVSAKTAGGFSKWDVDLSRLQALPFQTTLRLNFKGQITNKNLDSAEQLVLGGAYVLPGYPQGALAGDSGYVLGAQLRHDLPVPLPGSWAGQVFANHGYAIINMHTWPGFRGPDRAEMTDVGLGLRWRYKTLVSKVYAAWNTGDYSTAIAPGSPVHVWWSVSYAF
jgi:Hemolysin activation/secretion protein